MYRENLRRLKAIVQSNISDHTMSETGGSQRFMCYIAWKDAVNIYGYSETSMCGWLNMCNFAKGKSLQIYVYMHACISINHTLLIYTSHNQLPDAS